MREIADKWLDWDTLGPLATRYHESIAEDVKADTRKLDSFEAFENGLAGDGPVAAGRGPGRGASLQSFAEQRRNFLLRHAAVEKTERLAGP